MKKYQSSYVFKQIKKKRICEKKSIWIFHKEFPFQSPFLSFRAWAPFVPLSILMKIAVIPACWHRNFCSCSRNRNIGFHTRNVRQKFCPDRISVQTEFLSNLTLLKKRTKMMMYTVDRHSITTNNIRTVSVIIICIII